ncbi:MAG: ATP-binding protein [Pseudomonadota bacterium]
MQDDLATLIRQTARRVRARDFVWTVAISTGIAAATVIFSLTIMRIAPLWLPLVTLAAFSAALGIRYLFSSGRDWAQPVQRAVDTELSASESELSKLRLLQGVANALPEPLFILNRSGVIEGANPAAENFTGLEDLEGRHLAAALRAPDVYEEAEKIIGGAPAHAVDFETHGDVARSCRAFVAPLDGVDDKKRVLVFIRHLTSERRVDQMRADFIASASHELRTPLASLIGFIETLRGHAKDDVNAREKFLKIMHSQAQRMQRLVADLMSLSRIELNEHVPPSGRVDLREVAEDVIEGVAPLLDQSEAIVDFENITDTMACIGGDRDEIVQAVQNLIDNALKYGGEPAMVKVRVGRGNAPSLSTDDGLAHRAGDGPAQIAARQSLEADNLVYVQIQDFGPGIERANLPRLTERFYRVNIERSRKRGGTGLGLAIVKHIVNRHRGGLYIESRLAAGSAFTCYFPSIDCDSGVGCAPGCSDEDSPRPPA